MLTLLADMLFTASRQSPTRRPDRTSDWENRFMPGDLDRNTVHRRYRFNPYRDLW